MEETLARQVAARGLPGGSDAVLYHRAIARLEGLMAVYDDGSTPQLLMTTYDYLGLQGHPLLNARAKEAIDAFGTGGHCTGAAAGMFVAHRRLEERLAAWLGQEDAILFPSGYQANLSAPQALAGAGDWVFSDSLNHASIVDGCHLARARGAQLRVFGHNDIADLRRQLALAPSEVTKLVICDAVFSADGDLLRLADVDDACRRYGAVLLLDEAHSFAALGPHGRGIYDHFALRPTCALLTMATLSKTLASVGGFLAGPGAVIASLRGAARGYVFSAALPAPAVAAAHAALDLLETEGEQRRGDLSGNISYFLHRARAAGIPLPADCRSGVLPVLIGDERRALETADHCRRHGVMVVPFVWPVCARGAARLRVNVTARHTRLDIDTAVARIAAALEATAP
ncbi:aminotransferase class I/II-fold pyridoxal phosphate-dependent enzyme [Streptomyces pratensis]|uniref:aminotransferase class I/II-fold pyridoxal phosphate-dependent enzyme n=1 Tax=Streptomyces pratensis TaxID=1169025 RepID=UPI003019A870